MYESSDTLLVQFLTTAIVFVYAAVRDLDNCGCGFQSFDNDAMVTVVRNTLIIYKFISNMRLQ